MLSVHTVLNEIKSDDRSFQLLLSLAAKGEEQGGWENERISALTEDPVLRPKVARHGLDEHKHGRLFLGLLKKRGLGPVPVPDDIDYTMLLERAGIGLSHARLREDRPLDDGELLAYLVHSRVTEQRAAEEVATQMRVFADDPEVGKAIRMIADDEVNHLSFCHEELLRLAARGHGDRIRRMLKRYALAEIAIYRQVSEGVVRRMAAILGWSRLRVGLMVFGIRAVYCIERLLMWRRMTTLRPPERPDALGESGRHGVRTTAPA